MKPKDFFSSKARYGEKLATKNWREYSKNIRNTKGNFCKICKRSNVSNAVHHWFYDERDPWEYEQNEVDLLCADCHKAVHEYLKQFRKFVMPLLHPKQGKVLNIGLHIGCRTNPLEFAYAVLGLAAHPDRWGYFVAEGLNGIKNTKLDV